ncbi:MAG: rhodanese-related sulfurtransferase [Planctomycetota bacterium]
MLPKLEELGFQNIAHLKSGLSGWTKAGCPIEK